MKNRGNVYKWLDLVRKRPQMYIRSLQDMQSQLHGYYQALYNHRIVESVPQMNHHFLFWVHYRTEWSTSCGWADAIEARSPELDGQLDMFFKLVDEYRQLKPTVLRTVRLEKHNRPTGKRVVIGLDGKMEKPKRVDILKYIPEPLHFLRFYYPDKIIDDSFLMKSDGTYDTTLLYAKRWVRDELQVKRDQWEKRA